MPNAPCDEPQRSSNPLQSHAAPRRLARCIAASQSAARAVAQWTLFFALSFALTAGVLILAHV